MIVIKERNTFSLIARKMSLFTQHETSIIHFRPSGFVTVVNCGRGDVAISQQVVNGNEYPAQPVEAWTALN